MQLTRVSFTFVCFLFPAFPETHTLDKEKAAAALDAAAKEGVELTAKSTVQNSVGVTAVLLTQPSVRRLFGTEIANTYAVVQLTISNKSPDAQFVVHSAYIDTSQWALGGGTKGFSVDGLPRSTDATEASRAGSNANRISSVESRIARGQLLDAQQWSKRNWTIRLLTVAGSLASGYSFAFKETGIAKGIAAFNGNLVPGVAAAWPDGSVAQQNRVSDFGYQTNKIVAKQSADIIVCFFPIDMFLSPPFRQIFLKSPALFLSPYQVLFTEDNKEVRKALGLKEENVERLRDLHACYSKIFEPAIKKPKTEELSLKDAARDEVMGACSQMLKEHATDLVTLDYIGRFGVQNIGVYVDGIMSVDVNTVPASIDQVTFEGDASTPDFWTKPGEKKGSIKCRFCQNGEVGIKEAEKLGFKVDTSKDDSDDQNLKFSFTTKDPIGAGQTLTFTVTKKPADAKANSQSVTSSPSVYTVDYPASISDVNVKDKKVTITGSGFTNTKSDPISVALHPDGSSNKDVSVNLPVGQAADKLTFDVPADLTPGCWNVQVKAGSKEVSTPKLTPKILSEASAKITSATRGSDSITLKGEQFADTSACGGKALTFRLQMNSASKGARPAPIQVTSKLISSTEATLALPAAARKGDWTVQALAGSDVASSAKLK